MSTGNISNPPSSAPAESKSARKKKAKAEAAAAAAAAAAPATPTKDDQTPVEGSVNGAEDTEHPYIKELQKRLRSVNKKLNAMEKVNSVMKENPDVSLDDLVASKKINNDQKAQALKKPSLEAEREQLGEQLTNFKKVQEELAAKLARQKESLEATHAKELKELEDKIRAEEKAEADKIVKQRLLIFSQFLRSAAARRQQGDEETELSKAFEGALLHVYGGNPEAVVAAEKLISGSEEHVISTEGLELTVSYAQVKQASIEDAPFAAEEAWVDQVAQADAAPPVEETTVGTDPTVAHAGLTELDANVAPTNGEAPETSAVPTASVDDSAANAAGDRWDTKAPGSEDPLAESFEMVPRDPTEVETAPEPAPATSTQSWAEETPAAATPAAAPPAAAPPAAAEPAPATNGDGFQEVPSSRGGRGRGNFQGERRGGYRGRGGPRGEGRGRGGYRGDRGDGYRGRGGYRGGRGRDNHQAQPSQ
ncbi:hypothetical protein BFW01_g4825 [Lasiodiplodia theobromae]|uniref:YAG7-like dimerisation domain-containing protein n=1 Tax=Lasiodiplodia theobromae TaxID=45133 RepID=A0A5N5DNT6_9PEZI|nr:Exo-beta-glucanase [Lasiodiplodia theobromae]KAB2579599.1 hypothetical protein DBV05_g1730 [Lasiodiplodia theobromae]KAF4542873.1 Exo-beta-glucanase [Lasiodiplodia theobromae]KAF9633930.1 hypothetical protein BFW01_g4825 [Lasiodiplodia theobromae]